MHEARVTLEDIIIWDEVSLGRGEIISIDEINATPGDYPVYSSSAKGTGEFGRYGKHMFDEELITWSVDGGGRPFYRPKHRFSVTNVCGYLRIQDSSKWNYRYLHAAMVLQHARISFDYQMKAHPSVIKKLYTFIPLPLHLQQHIAKILSTVDEAIEHTEALIAKTQQIKAGLMHDLFTRGVTPDGQLRTPRKEAPELYKESPLGWIPKEWNCSHLSERRSVGRPHIKTGPFGSSLKREHWVEEGVPVITIGALCENKINESELFYVSEAEAVRLRDYQLDTGDVVFSRVADVGRSAVITAAERGWIMSSNLMRISLDRARVIPAFLQAQLAYDSRVRAQIRAKVNSGGRDVANSAILNQLHFSWPSVPEQKLIVVRFSTLEASSRCTLDELHKLLHLRAGVMDDLLTGRVRVATETSAKPAPATANV